VGCSESPCSWRACPDTSLLCYDGEAPTTLASPSLLVLLLLLMLYGGDCANMTKSKRRLHRNSRVRTVPGGMVTSLCLAQVSVCLHAGTSALLRFPQLPLSTRFRSAISCTSAKQDNKGQQS